MATTFISSRQATAHNRRRAAFTVIGAVLAAAVTAGAAFSFRPAAAVPVPYEDFGQRLSVTQTTAGYADMGQRVQVDDFVTRGSTTERYEDAGQRFSRSQIGISTFEPYADAGQRAGTGAAGSSR